MQTANTNPALQEMREKITTDTKIYIVSMGNNALRVSSKIPGQPGKEITLGLSRAFGFALMPNGLCCSEYMIIESLVEQLPQIRQENGELNIVLWSSSPYEKRKIE